MKASEIATHSNMVASRLLRQPCRQLLSSRSIAVSQAIIHQRTRAFHASTPRKDALDVFLYPAHEMLQYLHVALPWYSAIPISAFIMRGLLVTTFGARSRSITSRYIALNPLRHAMTLQIRDRVMKKGGFTNPKQAIRAVTAEVRKETSQLDKRWDCTLRGQFFWTFAQLPLFLMMAEIMRRMAGTKDGLLKITLSTLGLSKRSDSDVSVLQGEYSTNIDINPWFEPALANEGMLWFPDLLVPDPSGVLPFIASGIMFMNIYTTKNAAGATESPSRFHRNLRRTLLLLSLSIGPLCQNLPAALMLYWASSSAAVMSWNVWLDWRYPVVTGFGPCKRPLLPMPPKTVRR